MLRQLLLLLHLLSAIAWLGGMFFAYYCLRPAAAEVLKVGSATRGGAADESGEAREGLGFLPEDASFHDFLTAEEFVDLAARLSGVPSSERRARVAAVLDRVGLRLTGTVVPLLGSALAAGLCVGGAFLAERRARS